MDVAGIYGASTHFATTDRYRRGSKLHVIARLKSSVVKDIVLHDKSRATVSPWS
jgi:hypothetical protein